VAVGPDMRPFTVEEALLHETEAAAEELFSAMEEGRRGKKLRMEGGGGRQGLIGSHAAHEGGGRHLWGARPAEAGVSGSVGQRARGGNRGGARVDHRVGG
jgi:hypothetical protein